MDTTDNRRFVILLEKVAGRAVPKEAIARHVEHLRRLDRDGRLELAGPFTDYPGGMVIVRAADEAEARRIAEEDPFVREGFRTCSVRTWLLARAENDYLLG